MISRNEKLFSILMMSLLMISVGTELYKITSSVFGGEIKFRADGIRGDTKLFELFCLP